MITDAQNTLCEDFDIGELGSGATGLVTNIIDLTAAATSTGSFVVFGIVTEAFAGLTSCDFAVETASEVEFDTTNREVSSASRTAAQLALGAVLPLAVSGADLLEYLTVRYTCTGDPTAGKISFYVVPCGIQTNGVN